MSRAARMSAESPTRSILHSTASEAAGFAAHPVNLGGDGLGARRGVLDDAALEVQLGVEVGVVAVAEDEVAALDHLDEQPDEVCVELGAGDPLQLDDRLGAGDRLAVGV